MTDVKTLGEFLGFSDEEKEKFREIAKQNSIRAEEERAEEERVRNEIERSKNEQLLSDFMRSVPPRFRDSSMDDFTSDVAVKLLNGKGAMVIGGNGLGKTHLAWALAKAWKTENPKCTVRIEKAMVMLSKIKARVSSDDVFEYAVSEFGGIDHLIIDECDKIQGTDYDYNLLYYLIDYRYENELHTIVIANSTKDAVPYLFGNTVIGRSIYSRLSGDGSSVIALTGKDRRKENERV